MEPTARFSNRVADYVKFRPGYPPELLSALEEEIGLEPNWKVADVGSGTGKLSELFLTHGCRVTGVEPNKEMREAGEQLLRGHKGFTSVDATAESTTLPDATFDLVTAGQAFHWFEPDQTRTEFRRILRPGAVCALIWNDRQVVGTSFLDRYEQLLRTFPEYLNVGHKTEGAMKLKGFFETDPWVWTNPNRQDFDWEGLKGRALSSSYVPSKDHPAHEQFLRNLRQIFDDTAENGQVSFLYQTQMFLGKL